MRRTIGIVQLSVVRCRSDGRSDGLVARLLRRRPIVSRVRNRAGFVYI
jgi:hypothetical protein